MQLIEFELVPILQDYPGKSTLWKKLAEEFYVDGSGKQILTHFLPNCNKKYTKIKTKYKINT